MAMKSQDFAGRRGKEASMLSGSVRWRKAQTHRVGQCLLCLYNGKAVINFSEARKKWPRCSEDEKIPVQKVRNKGKK